jgi:hypothetical protein
MLSRRLIRPSGSYSFSLERLELLGLKDLRVRLDQPVLPEQLVLLGRKDPQGR